MAVAMFAVAAMIAVPANAQDDYTKKEKREMDTGQDGTLENTYLSGGGRGREARGGGEGRVRVRGRSNQKGCWSGGQKDFHVSPEP